MCAKCPAGIPFWTGFGCAQACPEEHDENNICRRCRDLDEKTPIWREGHCAACGEADGGVFWDKESERCVPVCPPERPTARVDRVCDACRSGVDAGAYWFNGSCVEQCPETWTELFHCEYCSERGTVAPKWSQGTCRSCGEGTDGEQPYWSPKEAKCVAACPDEEPSADEQGTCQKCPDGAEYWNPAEGSCVARCPETFDGNRICVTCAAKNPEHPYFDAGIGACNYCPLTTPFWNGN